MKYRVGVVTLIQATALAAVFSSVTLIAQSPTNTPRPAFEVASIKRSLEQTAKQPSSIGEIYPGGVWRAKAATVYGLIRTLYPRHTVPGQIDGVRDWVGTEFYDIDARGTPSASPDEMREMARTLLAERFKLA